MKPQTIAKGTSHDFSSPQVYTPHSYVRDSCQRKAERRPMKGRRESSGQAERPEKEEKRDGKNHPFKVSLESHSLYRTAAVAIPVATFQSRCISSTSFSFSSSYSHGSLSSPTPTQRAAASLFSFSSLPSRPSPSLSLHGAVSPSRDLAFKPSLLGFFLRPPSLLYPPKSIHFK